MEMRLLKMANTFVMNYRRVVGDKIALTALEDAVVAKGYIEKAMALEDKELSEAAMDLANGMKIVVAPKGGVTSLPVAAEPKMAPIPSKINAADWVAIESAAMKIGGPISGVLLNQVKDEAPQTFDAAVESMAEKLGSGYGNDFRREVRANKR